MKRAQSNKPTYYCENCVFGEWFCAEWNLSIVDGKPITIHCNYAAHPKKGILRGSVACGDYKEKTMI